MMIILLVDLIIPGIPTMTRSMIPIMILFTGQVSAFGIRSGIMDFSGILSTIIILPFTEDITGFTILTEAAGITGDPHTTRPMFAKTS